MIQIVDVFACERNERRSRNLNGARGEHITSCREVNVAGRLVNVARTDLNVSVARREVKAAPTVLNVARTERNVAHNATSLAEKTSNPIANGIRLG